MGRPSLFTLLCLATLVFDGIFILVFASKLGPGGKIPLIPGTPALELIIVMLSPIILVPLFSRVFQPLMLKIYPKLGKKLKKSPYELAYYIYERDLSNKEIFTRIFFAAMVALTLGLVIAQGLFSVGIEIFPGSMVGSVATMTYFLLPIVAIIIPPLGWLDDLGIVLYKRIVPHTNCPEVVGVGQYIGVIYKGFVGITTPVVFISIIIREIRIVGNLLEVLLLIIFPLFLTGYFVPMELWMRRQKQQNLEKVAKVLNKLRQEGIPEINLEPKIG
jgi:hypothetical protein